MRRAAVAAGGVLALSAFVACSGLSGLGGGSSNAMPSPPPGAMVVTMSDYSFTPSGVTVPAGKLLFLENTGGVAHDMVVLDTNRKPVAKSDMVDPGSAASFDISKVPAGSYTIICDVPGHEGQGMLGTLTVQ